MLTFRKKNTFCLYTHHIVHILPRLLDALQLWCVTLPCSRVSPLRVLSQTPFFCQIFSHLGPLVLWPGPLFLEHLVHFCSETKQTVQWSPLTNSIKTIALHFECDWFQIHCFSVLTVSSLQYPTGFYLPLDFQFEPEFSIQGCRPPVPTTRNAPSTGVPHGLGHSASLWPPPSSPPCSTTNSPSIPSACFLLLRGTYLDLKLPPGFIFSFEFILYLFSACYPPPSR